MDARNHDSDRITRLDPALAFFTMALLYFTVAAGWMVLRAIDELIFTLDLPMGRWAMLHFITIGAATQALFGSLPALSAQQAREIPRRLPGSRWTQWFLLNVGWILVLMGMSGGSPMLASLGALFVIAAVFLLLVTTYSILRAASSPIAIYYRSAPLFFVVGLVMAVGMLLGWSSPNGYFGMLEAHVHANVWGFLALVAAGSLYLLVPIYANRPLARPRWQRPTFWLLVLGAAGLVVGPWLGMHAFTFGGLGLYAIGVLLLLINLITTFKAGRRTAAGHHFLWAYLWMIVPVPIAPFVLLTPNLIPAAQVEASATTGLVYGWILQMVMGGITWIILRLRDPQDGYVEQGRVAVNTELQPIEAGTPWSVVAINVGVGLLWLQPLLVQAVWGSTVRIIGFILVATGMGIFIGRPWRALTGAWNQTVTQSTPGSPSLSAD